MVGFTLAGRFGDSCLFFLSLVRYFRSKKFGCGLTAKSDEGEIFVGNVLTYEGEMDRIIRYKILMHHGLRSFIE